MKKFLKITSATLMVIAAIILVVTFYMYNSWSPGEIGNTYDISLNRYFSGTYEESRASFMEASLDLESLFDSVDVFRQQVPGKPGDDLTIDFCYLPPAGEKSKLLILTSGIHGIEGITGSAVQRMFMDRIKENGHYEETGILFVHAMNPYGFKYLRRVTGNNVDLNRNWDTDPSLFNTENMGYHDVYTLLNPEGKANSDNLKNRFFLLVAIERLVKESIQSLRQAILQGQYEYPEGLYFGGRDFEPQVGLVTPIFKKYAAEYETVVNIDLHTGYGELGTLHLFPNPVENPEVKKAMQQIFEGYTIDFGDSEDFYTINGSFSDYIGLILPGKLYVPMIFEFGTLNSQTTLGSIHSLHNMILENQGFLHGYKNDKVKEKIAGRMMEMYNPTSESWRAKVLTDSREALEKTLMQMEAMN
jgi:hypothetical protein